MIKKGDRVRFLNSTGGGIVTRTEGRLAYVEDEDGFEMPVLAAELVAVSTTDFAPKPVIGRPAPKPAPEPEPEPAAPVKTAAPEPPAPETPYGDRPAVSLAFEPRDIRRLSETEFTAVLVNDSNYSLSFTLASRSDSDKEWTLRYADTVEPNTQIDLFAVSHADLQGLERVAFQCVAFKSGKPYALRRPVAVELRPDLTKFYKLHCFRPGMYFDGPVLEWPLLRDGAPADDMPDPEALRKAMGAAPLRPKEARRHEPRQKPASPTKLLPLIEVDLHASELLDSTAGMDNSSILNYQLDAVRRTMAAHSRRKGQKIVFIHGKGEGVLRRAVLDLLGREYPRCERNDASFAEYGFGATLVTVH